MPAAGYKKQRAEVREQTNGDFQNLGLSLSLTHFLESALMACGLDILLHSFGGKMKVKLQVQFVPLWLCTKCSRTLRCLDLSTLTEMRVGTQYLQLSEGMYLGILCVA